MRKIALAAAALAVAGTGLAAVQTPASAGVAWQVNIKASSTQVKLGDTVVFTGKVGPSRAAAGHQVLLQEKFKPGKPWRTQDKDKVDGRGHYKVADKPTVNTQRQYRVVMPATSKHAKGISIAVTVKVYGWNSLLEHPAVNQDGIFVTSSLNLNGTAFPRSIAADLTRLTSIEFNVNHKCIALRGTFGVNDNSQTGAQSTITAASDGAQIYTNTLSLGQTDFKKLTLASPLKLKFTALSVVPDVRGFGGVGTPEILCVQ